MLYTRFERARIIGARALQISMGAPPFFDTSSNSESLAIAVSEFLSGKTPLNVTRIRDADD
ncbi:MAG: DNA-directed RNA polymerase subunit K [Methanobacteriota archaeon]|nr:MAG: DNA-directed RNA polymerase subunit K [Euryarchaeota archaeon]